MKHNKFGFTLIELIIVIAILSILMLVAFPAYNKYVTDSRKAADAANCKVIYDAALIVHALGGTVTAGAPAGEVLGSLVDGIPLAPQAGGANYVIVLSGSEVASVNNGGAGELFVSYP